MTIKSIDNYVSQLWDWGFLDKCFDGSRIKLSDIDGIVERNGRFLVIECKSHDVDVSTGQRIMFENMVKTGFFHVMVLWGEPNKPERMMIFSKNGTKNYDNINENDVQKSVSQWYRFANKRRNERRPSVKVQA